MGPTRKEKLIASMAFLTYKKEDAPVNDQTVFIIAEAINNALAEGYGSLPAGSWQIVWGPALYAFDLVEKKQANLTFVAQSTSNPASYIAATRGTVGKDLLEWLDEDFLVSLVNWPTPTAETASPKISRATANALKTVLKTTPPFPKNIPDGHSALPGAGIPLSEFLAKQIKRGLLEICFTGHSLGGAIAPMLALWFRQAQGDIQIPQNDIFWPMPTWDVDCCATISCISFAGATPGDTVLHNYFAKLMGIQYERIYNTYDIVPYAFSNLDAVRKLYGDTSPLSEVEALFLDAIECDRNAAEHKADSKYATLPNDSPFTAVLQKCNPSLSFPEQASYQHSQAYITQFDAGDNVSRNEPTLHLPNFSCPVYKLGDNEYQDKRYQYATTSRPKVSMSPAAIIYPKHPNADPDVKKAIAYARENNLGIAVRTGGHAYSGTSSTNNNNIQIDLSEAYNDWDYSAETGLLRLGISYSLQEFNTRLKDAGLFMPTGQCYDVHVGGHAQTGGYGQLSRAFGLFSDQIVSIEIFLADGTKRVIAVDSPEQSDKNLFFAVLGGGPGNYGIVTHITIHPFKDSDHRYARALKKLIPYDRTLDHNVLVQLLDLVKEWEYAPGDYDFCVTIGSAEEHFIANQIGDASKDDFMIKYFGDKSGSSPFSALMVFFQYSNLDNKPNTYDPKWCNKIEAILSTANHGASWWERVKLWFEQKILNLIMKRDNSKITPISESVTQLWTYEGEREYNYPFRKNGQVTDKVASSDWSEWAARRIDEMCGRSQEGLMVFAQFQNFGGQNSAMKKNGRRKQTSYAWRNTTIGYELDVFYNPSVAGTQTLAEEWQHINRTKGIGQNGKFSTDNHRWFWASHGDLDMCDVWPYYYSSKEDYDRCCQVKATVDPTGVFTPNTFVVGYTPDSAPKHLALPIAPVDEATVIGRPEDVLDDAAFTQEHADRAKQRAEAKGIHVTFR